MRYEKLDPALQIEVQKTAARYSVFVHTDARLSEGSNNMLTQLNAVATSPVTGLYTAELTRQEIDQLSEQDWVRHLRLSQSLRPL